jgi:PTH1 family peptidyl-tRNA hydrolase
MIKLIVGLGNPGQQYEKNRHNAGFLFLDCLLSQSKQTWVREVKLQGWLANIQISNQKIILLKPETFMNRSGQSVGLVTRYYKITAEEVLVVHDELDFAAGLVKLKQGGGHAGHNGLRDIIAHLGSKDFYRLRIGIGRPLAEKSVADYVLSNPSKVEMNLITRAIENSQLYLPRIIVGDTAAVMNELHSNK